MTPVQTSYRPAYRLEVHASSAQLADSLVRDVRAGLAAEPRTISPKYFYDPHGCELFEAITDLPEYYQTRTELTILETVAADLVRRHEPTELVELGSGSSRKTAALLDPMAAQGLLQRYVPFDIAPTALLGAASRVADRYPGVDVHAVAGDFLSHLDRIPGPEGTRLVMFLGGTIGNLHPPERSIFLEGVRALLEADDILLIGTDLTGDIVRTEAAYNDSAGVTAAFNQNVLRVLNRELAADFDLTAFEHVAFFDHDEEWIEMRLRAVRDQVVNLGRADLTLTLRQGEEIRTEISCKFTRSRVAAMYPDAGLELVEWHTDPEERFAVSVARVRGADQA